MRDFIASGHKYSKIIDSVDRQVVEELTKDTFRPARAATSSSLREERARSRSSSVDPLGEPTWPLDWSVDRPGLRQSIKAFQASTAELRQQFDPLENKPSVEPQEHSEEPSDRRTAKAPERRSPSPPPSGPPSRSPSRTRSLSNQPRRSATSEPRQNTSQTSADESIPRQPITKATMEQSSSSGAAANNNAAGQSIDIESIITNAIARYVRDHPPQRGSRGNAGPPGEPGPPGPPGQDGTAGTRNGSEPRFVAADVGFFDPFYDGKSSDTAAGMEHTGKDTYFRDVIVFIDRIKDVARVKGAELLRTNLQICLRGEALEWYTCQLTDNEKRLLTYGNDVDEWGRVLLERFGPTKASGMAILVKERYTLHDAMRHREPREYAMTIIRAAKVAKLGDIPNQLDVIWNGLDVEFQSDIDPPTAQTTLNQFLTSIDLRKQQWWTKAARMTKGNTSSSGNQQASYRNVNNQSHQSQGRNNSSQSQYNQSKGIPYRAGNTGYQNPGFQNRQPPPAQNFQAYNQSQRPYETRPYGNRPYDNQQGYGKSPAYPRRDQQMLPAPAARRQITSGPGYQQNVFGSRPQGSNYPATAAPPYRPPYQNNYQPPAQSNYQSNAPRPPYLPQQQQQRAYQASVDDQGMHDESQSREDSMLREDELSSFHNDYNDEEGNDDYAGYDDVPEVEPDVNFVEASSLGPTYTCQHCEKVLESRNKLFQHLRTQCWLPQNNEGNKNLDDKELDGKAEVDPTRESPKIVESTALPTPGQGHGTSFRGFQHTKADIRFAPECDENTEVCLDPGCPITLGDRELLRKAIPDFDDKIRKQAPVPVRGYGNKITNATEYINIDLYFPGTVDGTTCLAKVPIEVHLTDDLKANMLIGTDILTPHKFVLNCASQTATIGSCQQAQISARSVVKPHSQIKRKVKSKSAFTLPPNSVTNIPISYQGSLPDDRDFLFEPELPESYDLGRGGGIFAHIVDASMTFIQARNNTGAPIDLPRHTRLGTVVEYAVDGCYQVSYKSASLAACGWRNSKVAAMNATVMNATTIDRNLERVLPNGVTVYGSDEAQSRIGAIVEEFEDVFIDTGVTIDIPEDQWMSIPLKAGAKSKPSKVYPLGQRDREVIDATFDKLQQQGKLRYSTQPTPFSWPCFVVWRDTPQGRKGRVVIDIRGLNAITEDDGYPLPLQSDIIALIAGYPYISTVDGVAWFHQFLVQRQDRGKLTIVSHRGQEESSVALMGYKGSPPYVQRQTDALLRPLRAFVRAFVDDIIIFSRTLAEHVSHLRQLFQLLREKRASLAPTKSFLGFPSVNLLGQRVDSLGMSTSEEKIKAITSLRFPASLRDLEIFLGLTGWLRNSIPRYAQRAQPLQERKTTLTQAMLVTGSEDSSTTSKGTTSKGTTSKGTTSKGTTSQDTITKPTKHLSGPARKRTSTRMRYEPTQAEIAAFQDLQGAFKAPTFLMHFDRKRKLFVDIDASKVWGFAAMVYHTKNDTATPARTEVQAIMFLSKSINTAEKNYWPTELEVAAIVWVVRKIRHLIEASEVPPVVLYTDHSAAVQISRQTTLSTSSTDKLNLRLVRASQYLSGFNLSIRHKAGKANVVPDALSRLQADTSPRDVLPDEKQDVLESLYGNPVIITVAEAEVWEPEPTLVYHTTLVEMSDDFKKRLIDAYGKDDQWKRILETIKRKEDAIKERQGNQELVNQELPAGFRFRKHNDLIYSTTLDDVGRLRLCIPESMQQEVFEMAHDKNFHAGFHTTYARIAPSIFIKGLTKHLEKYIKHCPECQLNQTLRHPTYGELNPIVSPPVPFHTITMDFIVALPYCDGKNELLTLTCKFTKKKLLVPGFDEWTAAEWANVFIVAVIDHDWGVPVVTISDRDSRFMSEFWKAVFQKLGTSLAVSTAYHPQTDGQSERTNQTVEIALRFHLTTGTDDWVTVLPFLQGSLNNSATSTGFAPNELSYGFRVRDTLGMLTTSDLPAEDLDKLRLIKREEANDAIAFANAMTKHRYDSNHKAMNLQEGSLVYLRLHHGYSIPGVNHKLSNQRIGPFKVLKKVGNLAYRLELPELMRIHPVISIAQLEPATDPAEDPYGRALRRPPPPPVELEQDDNPELTAKQFKPYEIEKLLDRRGEGENIKYLVKWKDYGRQHNVWYPVHALGRARELMEECDARISADPTRQRRKKVPVTSPQASNPQASKRRGRPRKIAQTTPTQTDNPIPSISQPNTRQQATAIEEGPRRSQRLAITS